MDFTMCEDWDCPNQDHCWRLLAPPELKNQAYQDFKFDYEAFEISDYKCGFYLETPEFNKHKE